LHALTLLNDENYLEASRALATLALDKSEPLEEMSLRVLSRELNDTEMSVLVRQRDRALDYYRMHPDAAATFLNRGQFEANRSLAAPEIAAYTIVASMLFNLDEAMTHE
jgi:hypothetical protein